MDQSINIEVQKALDRHFSFKATKGKYRQQGKCPDCGQREVYCVIDNPVIVKCGRANNCGSEWYVRDLFPEIFENWSKRAPPTEENPNATADAYLQHQRGLDLHHLRGCYTQETYQDQKTSLTSATVRFAIGDTWWERLIDRPERFDKKARFKWGGDYKGLWWTPPESDLVKKPERLTGADDIWICEGIFDAAAMNQAGLVAVSCMSTNNYPDLALRALRKAIADGPTPNKVPRLIWAFDVGKAGIEWAEKSIKRARLEDWKATAAQVRPDGEGTKLDWNDLLQRNLLTSDHIEEYLYNGELTIAEDATTKAWLIHKRKKISSFHFKLKNQTWWCSIGKDEEMQPVANVKLIANCAFQILYRERDELIDETNYYLSVRFPNPKMREVKARFSAGTLTSNGDFKKRLFSFGGMWQGSDGQLTKIVAGQSLNHKTVTPIDFLGYSREHGAWVLGDLAVAGGRVIKKNAEDYFEVGKYAVKLRTAERILTIAANTDNHNFAWYQHLATAFETKGIVALSFFTMTFFAEQIRARTKSLGFLEMCGMPGTGKSTLLMFMWLLTGRNDNYEGFDPAKATAAAIGRNFASVSNLPVVLMEGDREEGGPHSKRFDFDELKPLWNGSGLRERGIRNAGNETYRPAFRAAIIIEQNLPVLGQPALLQRIMQIEFDTHHFSEATKKAVAAIESWDTEAASTYMLGVIQREKPLLELFFKNYVQHLADFTATTGVRSERLLKNHAQLAAAVDMLAAVVPMTEGQQRECIKFIAAMCVERNQAVSSDHPLVEKFWEIYDYLIEQETDEQRDKTPLNCSRKDDSISINLQIFEERMRNRGLQPLDNDKLRKHLKTSKVRKFLCTKSVNAPNNKIFHCWVFQRPSASQRII